MCCAFQPGWSDVQMTRQPYMFTVCVLLTVSCVTGEHAGRPPNACHDGSCCHAGRCSMAILMCRSWRSAARRVRRRLR